MIGATVLIRKHAPRLAALAIILVCYSFTRLPNISQAERDELAKRFRFQRFELPELPSQNYKSIRKVNPGLSHLSSWISAVGAAVALNDMDGDGLPNDICQVDPRIDQVLIAPVPGTRDRYQPFVLNGGAFYESATMAPMGCVPSDLNEDGLMDMLVYYWGRTPLAFLRKQETTSEGLSTQSYIARELVEGNERWYTNALTVADLDGDGHVDVIAGNYIRSGSHILDPSDSTPNQMQDSMSRAFNGGGGKFIRWVNSTSGPDPTVSFALVDNAIVDQQAANIAGSWTLAIGAADLDNDLMPEIYFANDFGPDRLLHNRSKPGELRFALLEGVKTLTTPTSKVLGRDSFKGMGVDFGDLNGDGFLDIYVSNIATEYGLEESHYVFLSTGETARMRDGVAPYVDASERLGLSRSGWAWDAKLADFDNDGNLEALQGTGLLKGTVNRWPELHELAIANDQLISNQRNWPRFQPGDALSDQGHNPFFVRGRDNRYYDLATELGLGEPMVTRGIAIADVDGDGRLDFAIANQWQKSYFYRNESLNPGQFLGMHLRLLTTKEGSAKVYSGHPTRLISGRSAVGVSVTVKLPNGTRLRAQTDGGNGHSGKRSQDLFFGLGSLSAESGIEVMAEWRDANGKLRNRKFRLTPGWHTILLGSGAEDDR